MGIVGRENCLDDCAEVACGDQIMVVTTDMLHRTTDFVPGMTDWQIGWMSAAVTISDIASMGAAPAYLLIAVGLDEWQHLAGRHAGCRGLLQQHSVLKSLVVILTVMENSPL